ncbi:MAG: helix-turn-helix transcriptional regulator [Acutalibacteraceae bacterium]|nr:helix-turn-helix transcriptional regulator [Acutalibacteraceae bacterium]
MNNKKTGTFIADLRREISLSQKQIAEKLNVTDKAVSKWETGRSAPDISLLIPLSEILGVTVTELLQGERLPEEKLNNASNEIIVSTIKKSRMGIILAVAFVFIIMCLIGLSYPAYHYFSSVDADNTAAIEKVANDYFRTDKEDMTIIKTVKKGDYYAFLIGSEKETKLRLFRKDSLFENRISVLGGSGSVEGDTVHLYCTGERGMTISVFYGYNINADEYSYTYRGVKCTKPIDDKTVLDMFVDVDDTWIHPLLEYK